MDGVVRYPSEFAEGTLFRPRSFDWDYYSERILRLDTLVAAHDGDFTRAASDVTSMLAFVNASRFHAGSDAVYNAARYSRIAKTIALSNPESWLERDLARVQSQLSAIDLRTAWTRYMRGEVAQTLGAIQHESPTYLLAVNQREVLRFFDTVLAAEGQTWPEIYDKHWDGIDAWYAIYNSSELKKEIYRPLRTVGYASDRLTASMARFETMVRCAELILAAARHHHRHGEFPDSGGAIDKDLFSEGMPPMDPWAPTEPIKLMRSMDSVTAYGVGPNQTDDRGQIEFIDGEEPDDIGLTWPISDTDEENK